jgi:hypothetical protein
MVRWPIGKKDKLELLITIILIYIEYELFCYHTAS